MPAFKPPEWKNARTTLTWAAIVFGILFLGIAYLATRTGIVPDPEQDQTVLSLLVRQIAGDGAILILAQVATALILVLAANTSFADFPRLSSFLARDGFLPRQFAFRGERLAFTTGIIALSGMAIGLLIVFKAQRQRPDPALHAGRVHRLHPVADRACCALVPAPRARLAARPGHQRPWRGHHRRGDAGGGRQQLL